MLHQLLQGITKTTYLDIYTSSAKTLDIDFFRVVFVS